MKLALIVSGLSLAGAGGTLAVATADTSKAATCAPSGELNFICGINNPEDLAVLPGERWIVSSGMAVRSGLHLIDSKTKIWERWIAPVARQKAPFDRCPSQPRPDEMQIHGISVRDTGDGHLILYAVNHGGSEDIKDLAVGRGHETIEIFDIDMSGSKPTLSWSGCIPMPDNLVANSVVSSPDGSVFATVFQLPGTSMADLWKGLPTGAVYKWMPGSFGFERVAGTELTGNNGIELSPDGKRIYVAHLTAVTAFTNTNPAKILKSSHVKWGNVDNMHWVSGRLVVAGPRTDLCAVSADGVPCMAGYFVATLDPETLAATELAKGEANAKFSGASSALPVGKTLWIGSYAADRLAYRALSSAPGDTNR